MRILHTSQRSCDAESELERSACHQNLDIIHADGVLKRVLRPLPIGGDLSFAASYILLSSPISQSNPEYHTPNIYTTTLETWPAEF